MTAYVVRERDLSTQTLEAAFTINALLVICLALMLTGLSFAAGVVFGERQVGAVLRVIAVGGVFAIFSFRPSAMLQRQMRFKALSAITVTASSVTALGTIGFALAGASYMSPAYASVLSQVATMALTLVLGREHVGFGLSLAGWRPITTFGLQVMSVNGVATVTGRLSELILGRLLGAAALGLYTRATQISSMIFDNLYGTATRVVFVQLTRDMRERGEIRTTFLRSFAMILACMWPFLIGLAILSGPVVVTLYGERWLPAALPLSALLVGQVLGVAFGMNWELFVLRGETGRQARYEVARLVVSIPLFVVGCLFGVAGAAVATIAGGVLGLIVYYPHIRRLAPTEPHELPFIYRDSAALTVAAVAPALGVMIVFDWSPFVPLIAVLAAVAAGVALWLALVFGMGHPLRDELLLLRRKLLLVWAGS
jgi:O-antigen/teichoic acid export membrane protein